MSNELATQSDQSLAKNDIRSLLQSDTVRGQVELALPKHMSPDRMMRVALTAINKNPKLLECTKASVLLSLMTCSQYGVEPDGRNAHLIPYKNSKKVGDRWETTMECQFQWDYKGLVAQIRRSPDVVDIYADIICQNDVYKITRGLHRDLIHEVDIAKPRGAMIAAYSVCLFRDGTASFELMTSDEIDGIRIRSKSTDKQTGKSSGPWATDYSEMAKKTVIKRHSKLLPLPTEIALALNADNEFDDIPQAQATEVLIKQASIPDKPQQATLPEPQPEPAIAQAKVVPQPQPEPAPRKLKTKKQDEPKPAELAAPIADTPAKKCRNNLAAEGHTEADLIKLGIAQDWLDKTNPPASLDDIDEETLQAFLDDWTTVIEEINAAKAAA